MSPGTSSQAGLAEYIATLLAETDLRPARLRLELPERALTAAAPGEATVEAEAPSAVLEALAALGVSLALDDVGTGLSSIESLARLPLDVLKLAPSALDSAVLVRAIVALGTALGVSVTAQGVADADALAHLRNAGVAFAEGPLFGPPLSAESVRALGVTLAAGEQAA